MPARYGLPGAPNWRSDFVPLHGSMFTMRNENPVLKFSSQILPRRHVPLLGGASTIGDCFAALRFLTSFHGLVEGDSIANYEKAFAGRIGVRHACSFCSGRVGLYGLLSALGIGTGNEVLLSVPTHIVVANAIRYTGAVPVYVDCDPLSCNMDLREARTRITPRTRAIILQHTFGIPVDLEAALDLAREYGIPVIEDCVHALGARYAGKPVGSFGKAAFFSTEETKTISTTMGGMVVTDDDEIARKMREFQKSCIAPSAWLIYRYILKLALYHILMQPNVHRYGRAIYEGMGNYHPLPRPTCYQELIGERPDKYLQRLGNAQALIGLRQLSRLDDNLKHRAETAARYYNGLAALGFKRPKIPPQAEPAFVRYPVLVEDREAVVRKLAPWLVPGTWFTSVLEEAISPYEAGAYSPGSCPRAEMAAKHMINLPTHPRVSRKDADTIIEQLKTAAYATPEWGRNICQNY